MRKIIFLDIDGTLVDCVRGMDEPSELTKEAIVKLKENGHLVFIASGRAKCLLPTSIIDLRPSGYLLANGAYAEFNDEIIFSRCIDLNAKRKIIAFAQEYNCAYYLETVNDIYTQDLNMPLHREFFDIWNVNDCYRDDGYRDDLPINIGMLAIPKSDELVKRVYEELAPFVNINRHGAMYSFDLNIKGNSKGEGIKELLKVLDISKDYAFAFGDGYNDIEMFKEVGSAIAVENAVDDLKKIATDITYDVIDDGVYYALKKYRLI